MERLWTEPWMVASLALGALLVLQTLRLWWARAWPRLRQLRRSARAVAGEQAAAGLLESLGYRIEAEQARGSWTIDVDGQPLEVALRADYLITRGGRRYVAEVKTGGSAPSLRTASTRRQLLEYRLAYGVDGVLLVDMEQGRVHEVEFPIALAGRPGAWRYVSLCLAALLGGAVGFYGASGIAKPSVKAGSSNVGMPASGGNGTSTSSRP